MLNKNWKKIGDLFLIFFMYFLLDANVTAGYYLHRSSNKKTVERITSIIDSVRSKKSDHFLYIPNFCIAEVIGVFSKFAHSWKKSKEKKISRVVYKNLINQFEKDIRNGKLIYHYELSRYHLLNINFIAPLDNYFKISRRTSKKKKEVRPMSTYDRLIISMGIELVRIHGKNKVYILTADERMAQVLDICNKKNISNKTIKKLRIDEIAEKKTEKKFSSALFPMCLNLETITKKELNKIFGKWPVEIAKIREKVYKNIKR